MQGRRVLDTDEFVGINTVYKTSAGLFSSLV